MRKGLRYSRERGFAVLLTLVLIAFLAVVITTLGTLSVAEGRRASAANRQAEARRNALLALNVALGRLQQLAGPDTRATCTAEAVASTGGTRHWTGVWESVTPGVTFLGWLVSGNERDGQAMTPTGEFPAVELVGRGTSGVANDVMAPSQPVRDATGAVTGHYAWWIGDEGVKATVGAQANYDAVTYAPFDSPERRARLRQQGPRAPAAVDEAGRLIFDANTAARGWQLLGLEQISRLENATGTARVGEAIVRANFHAWTVGHRSVLADTKRGGLKCDLSLKPGLLGEAFAAWADYRSYLEDPAAPVAPTPLPAYPSPDPRDALRRRYRMTASRTSNGVTHGVTPVLSYFLLTFNVRTDPNASGSVRPIEVRARWLATLWNPFTSGLVPEDLELEVSGLPAIQVVNDATGASTPVALDALYGAPLRIALPWTPAGRADQQTWLPGRVYTWASREDLNKANPVPSGGFASEFYTRTLSTAAGQGVQRSVTGASMANSAPAHILGAPTELGVSLFHRTASGARELLARFTGPEFAGFATTPGAISAATYQFSYVFHLAESADTPMEPDVWLTSAGLDPRESALASGAYLPGANGPRPELYPNYTTISFPDRLLDRALPAGSSSTTGQSYNEDAPLFELPRQPLVSVGTLQGLHTTGTRPFAVGNSWGDAGGWNSLFDRTFFSGLTAETPAGALQPGAPLPNPLLRISSTKADGSTVTVADLKAEAETGNSARYLLQEGAFNVNSVNSAAWRALLFAGRTGTGGAFDHLASTTATGTAGDSPATSVTLDDVAFFRFPFSAQETFKADAGYAASTTAPPAAPNQTSLAATHLFRRGARALSADQVLDLADAIAGLVRQRRVAAGPFRSLEEFLGPSELFGGASLLEKAIATARGPDGRTINDPAVVPEFSSQWLTAGDLLGALAPLLTVRSDLFRIRVHGSVTNPVTLRPEAQAWAEALVQRGMDFIDATQDPATAPENLNPTNRSFGRRFRIVRFRWLTHSDL